MTLTDDIVELEESLEKAQILLDLLCLTAEEVGLCIDTTKTKLITCSIPHSSLQLDGEDIENDEDFQFLGSYILSTGEHLPERGNMKCGLEIGSCLEVSCITPTKVSTFQSVSFNCASIWL